MLPKGKLGTINGDAARDRTLSISHRASRQVTIKEKFQNRTGFNAEGILGNITLPPPPPAPKPKVYTFSEDDSEKNILFTGDVLDDRPVIKAATLEKLVERLTYEKYPDPDYTQAFLLTYRTFTSPNELLNILKARYNIKPPENATPEQLESFKQREKPIRLRFV